MYLFIILKTPKAKTPPMIAVQNCGQDIIWATLIATAEFNNKLITMPEVKNKNKYFKAAPVNKLAK